MLPVTARLLQRLARVVSVCRTAVGGCRPMKEQSAPISLLAFLPRKPYASSSPRMTLSKSYNAVANRKCSVQPTYHIQQLPRAITRLRPNTNPVFRPRHIQLHVLERPLPWVSRLHSKRIIRPQHFERFRVARCPIPSVNASALWSKGMTYLACATTML